MSIKEITAQCNTCNGQGQGNTVDGNPLGTCLSCGGSGRIAVHLLDDDFIDKLNDIENKVNDIFELLSTP